MRGLLFSKSVGMNWIKQKIAKYFFNKAKLWGVAFNRQDKPPEFIVTKHAQDRLGERLIEKRETNRTYILEVWLSSEKIPQIFIDKKTEIKRSLKVGKIEYRRFDGMVFVFSKCWLPEYQTMQKHLITAYPDDSKLLSFE